mmetsp:Transcript_4708/g.8144  ORF Transcript_4708/g.8144 Transcript_4708/m.8144 type:complete len:198 (+) Transcript_4708:83-676(+)|eukprot:CAMPEP_0119108988 /NCGR_PEP_ID=MMETSP1180-20130426/16672_1 /TAXON_ID=3052 ORGANISM="Chlamydomonas cf sp, Strain CCMP681" /NCGR_SAMPLE_ID=MMETSP1180 /ASSEMBLY_ACC=CAM_ASM_000741 /LENGTH=197 /DNA_ID=CAMNT_0007094679 /DNA_START=82 /DNA_END=675 /DNA_ORIENTATION=+
MGKGNPGKARFASSAQDDQTDDKPGPGGAAADFRASDGLTDVSYHTPAWHAARIESLLKPRPTYEEWSKKAKEEEAKLTAVADDEAARHQEYRAQLDADRAARMGKPAGGEEKSKKRKKKDSKDSKKKKSKTKDSKIKKKKKSSKDSKKRRRSSSSSGSSGSDSSDSDSDSDKKSKKSKKEKKEMDIPVRLSEYLKQ